MYRHVVSIHPPSHIAEPYRISPTEIAAPTLCLGTTRILIGHRQCCLRRVRYELLGASLRLLEIFLQDSSILRTSCGWEGKRPAHSSVLLTILTLWVTQVVANRAPGQQATYHRTQVYEAIAFHSSHRVKFFEVSLL